MEINGLPPTAEQHGKLRRPTHGWVAPLFPNKTEHTAGSPTAAHVT